MKLESRGIAQLFVDVGIELADLHSLSEVFVNQSDPKQPRTLAVRTDLRVEFSMCVSPLTPSQSQSAQVRRGLRPCNGQAVGHSDKCRMFEPSI
jgi:hypothetical protein